MLWLGSFSKKQIFVLAALLVSGLLLRISIATLFYGTYDTASWTRILDHWHLHLSPYDVDRRYSYSPIWFWILSAASMANGFLKWPPYVLVKLPLILADTAILVLLLKYASAEKRSFQSVFMAGALFFLNPVSVLNTAYHSQFDNIACLFCLFACYWMRPGGAAPRSRWPSMTAFSIGASVKHWLFLVTPVFAFRQKTFSGKALFFLTAPIFFLLTLAPYFLNRDPYVVQNVFLDSTIHLRTTPHSGWPLVTHELFHWGTNGVSRLNPLIYLAHLGLAYFLAKKSYDLVDSLIIYLLFFYSTSVYVAPQYSLWVIPFAALRKDKTFFGYSLITTVHLVAFYFWATWQALGDTAHMEDAAPFIKVFRGLAWAVSLFWLIKKLRAPVVRAGN